MAELRFIALSGLGGDRRETGGILMGTADGGELRLNACEEVPSEHRTGTEYKLGASDRIRLEEVLAKMVADEVLRATKTSRGAVLYSPGPNFDQYHLPTTV